jgi:hypothetical protein
MTIAARSYSKHTDRVALAASTVAGVLEAIADATGAIRTAMEADGWEFETDLASNQGGIALKPPLATAHRIVIAGVDTGSPTPAMLTPDTFASGIILTGLARKVTTGTFDWDASLVGYTGSAEFTGYWRALAPVNSTHITIEYTGHSLTIALDGGTDGSLKLAFLGGRLIPPDEDFVDTDGRVWGMHVVGGVATAGMSVSFWTSTTSNSATVNGIFRHATANGNAHSGFWRPDENTWVSGLTTILSTSPAMSSVLSQGSSYLLWPIPLTVSGFAFEVEGVYAGDDRLHATEITEPGASEPAVLIFANGHSTTQDAVWFEMKNQRKVGP